MATITDMRAFTRELTGRKSPVQLSDTQLDFQLNDYYQYYFPAQFRSLDLRLEYEFVCTPNVDTYPILANTYQSFEPTAYVAGYPTIFVMDRTVFHRLYPDPRADVLITTSAGTTNTFTGTIAQGTPILQGSVLVYASTSFNVGVSCVDTTNSTGNLYLVVNSLPDFTQIIGSVNYQTGAVTVTFPGPQVPAGNEVRAQFRQYNGNRPTTIFYFDETIILRPVPDKAYSIRLIAYMLPTALITSNPAAAPTLNEWWRAICFGAAMRIFQANKDWESAKQMEAQLEDELVLVGRREWFQLRSQRAPSMYNNPAFGTNPAFYYGFVGPW